MQRTTILLTAAICLTLAGCSSNGEDNDASSKPSATTTTAAPAPTPSVTPSLSQEETARQCTAAIAEEAPGWDDWNYSPGEWQDDPRTPEVCLGLADEEFPPNGNRAFMDALVDGLQMATSTPAP